MILHGFAPAFSHARFVRSAIATPLVVDSVTAVPTMPGTCGAVVCFGPSAVPCTTTGMPASMACRAHGMSGGPDTALRTNASYFLDAIASWQLASSRWTSLFESNVVTDALFAAAVALALLMITCSTGLAWIATKCAMLTCLFALPEPVVEAVSPPPELLPQAATPAIAPTSNDTARTCLTVLSSRCSHRAHMCADPPAPVL